MERTRQLQIYSASSGDDPFSLWPAFTLYLVQNLQVQNSTYNATLTGQDRQGDIQLKIR